VNRRRLPFLMGSQAVARDIAKERIASCGVQFLRGGEQAERDSSSPAPRSRLPLVAVDLASATGTKLRITAPHRRRRSLTV